jgi:hypothetical protein
VLEKQREVAGFDVAQTDGCVHIRNRVRDLGKGGLLGGGIVDCVVSTNRRGTGAAYIGIKARKH